jgi:glycosyltransferase involved in cell wall biosynthesis
MNKLSAVIITLNEGDNIAKCINSIRGVADEIVVVDSFSSDRTTEIAENEGARVIQNKFEGHIQQKNFAKQQAASDWVLSIDADEVLSAELEQSILEAKQNFTVDGFTMNRLNFYCGKPIKTCGWYPDTKLRLWNRTKGEWTGVNPHDTFELYGNEQTQHLKGDILHNTYPTHEAFLNQVEKFATISAKHLKGGNVFYLIAKMLFSPPFKFIRNYFWKLGFTEGKVGLIICAQQSREVFLKYYRAIKLKYQ